MLRSLVTKSERSSGHKIFHCLCDNTSDLPIYHFRFYLLTVRLINLGFLEEMEQEAGYSLRLSEAMAHLLSCTTKHRSVTAAASSTRGVSKHPPSSPRTPGVWQETDINLTQGILINEQKNTEIHFFSIIFTLACEDVKHDISFSVYTVIAPNLKPS